VTGAQGHIAEYSPCTCAFQGPSLCMGTTNQA